MVGARWITAPAKCELLSVIKFLHAKMVALIEIHHQLEEVCCPMCIDLKNVRKWSRKFTACRLNVHDEQWNSQNQGARLWLTSSGTENVSC